MTDQFQLNRDQRGCNEPKTSDKVDSEINIEGTLPTLTADTDLSARARVNFIRKVYAILAAQLLLTVVFCFISYFSTPFLNFQIRNQWLFWTALGIQLLTIILIICTRLGRKTPWNYLLLLTFTLCEAYFISAVCSLVAQNQGPAIVLVAAAMTFGIVLGLTLYAMHCKINFSTLIAIAIVGSIALMMMVIISLLAWSPWLSNFYCAICVILAGIYLIFDTKIIIDKNGMSLDDYILAAMTLYLDIIRIFVYILSLLSKKRFD